MPGQVEEVIDHTDEGVGVGLEVSLRQHEGVLELGPAEKRDRSQVSVVDPVSFDRPASSLDHAQDLTSSEAKSPHRKENRARGEGMRTRRGSRISPS
jgi:hypothetical protein